MEHKHRLKKRERTHKAIMHSAKMLFEEKGLEIPFKQMDVHVVS